MLPSGAHHEAQDARAFERPVEVSVPKIIGYVFDVFEKDRYALLQLINEVPELWRAAQPFSIENLVHRTTRMFFEQHFADVDPAIIARKSYIIDKSVIVSSRGIWTKGPIT